MLPSKFEANPTFRRRVKCASFSLFPVASSCLNAYFCVYMIMTGWFLNTVTECRITVGHRSNSVQ